jgi:hypothetical protein
MADIDTQVPPPGESAKTPETADKAGADKLAADATKLAADKLAADEADAEAAREAELDKRAQKKAEKLAEKLASERIAARDAEAQKKADREKLDVLEAAKLDKADLQAKLDKMTADAAAANLRAELATTMVAKGVKPASESAMSYISAAVAREVAGGLDTEKALAAVAKSEAFLFAQPQAPGQPAKVVDTSGKAGGGSEREVQQETPKTRQYQTKNPGDIDPADTAGLNASIRERHGISLPFN